MKNDKRYIYTRKVKGNTYYYVQVPNMERKAFSTARMSEKQAWLSAVKYRDECLMLSKSNSSVETSVKLMYTLEYAHNRSYELYSVSASTRRSYTSVFDNYFDELRMKPITDVTVSDIQRLYSTCASTKKERVLSIVKLVLTRCYNTAILDGLAINNLANVVPLPRINDAKKEKQVITNDLDTFRMVSACLSHGGHIQRLIAYVILVIKFTGMRPSEVFALSRNSIQDGNIIINSRVGSSDSTRQLVKPKTGNAYRSIPVCEPLRLILDELMSETDSDFLFTFNGRFLEINNITHYVSKIANSLDINFNLYMLRHTFVKTLIDSGVNQRTVMDLMGHASFNQSLYYSRTNDSQKLDAIRLFEKNN